MAGSHEVRAVVVDDSAERHTVTERRRHVGNLHVPVALRYVLAPLLQAPQSRLPRHARRLVPELRPTITIGSGRGPRSRRSAVLIQQFLIRGACAHLWLV